jgi:hypothetical protein
LLPFLYDFSQLLEGWKSRIMQWLSLSKVWTDFSRGKLPGSLLDDISSAKISFDICKEDCTTLSHLFYYLTNKHSFLKWTLCYSFSYIHLSYDGQAISLRLILMLIQSD